MTYDDLNDYQKAAAIARAARTVLNDLYEVLKPHKDEVLCYCDGIYPESIDFVFCLSDIADEVENLDDYIPYLDALARGEEPKFNPYDAIDVL